ncbi:MAG TPA: aldo/keto reductase [Candidatus Dormibacteraeota bacterium]
MTPGATAAREAGTWVLGDLTVNRIGFGAMRLTGSGVFDRGAPSDRSRSVAALRRAIDLGVNHIDTAAFYFSRLRSANELINRALAPYPDDLVITTKVGPGRDPSGEWLPWATPDQLRGQVEENLRMLGLDVLNVVNLRVPGPGSIAEHFGALEQLRAAGLIRHLGVSGVTLEQLAEAQAIAPVVCVQNRFAVDAHLADSDDVLRICGDRGIAFVPYFAVAGAGRHRGWDARDLPEVISVASAHGVSPAQVRLAWTLQQGRHVLAIPGSSNPEHVTDNVGAGSLRLSDEELASLASVHAGGSVRG